MAKHIDPIYRQYASRIIKYVASTEFYEYFMAMVENGKNVMQFSNRKIEKTVDETWVTAIEACMKPMEEIINNPRNFIMQEEIIVNVALAKRVTPDTVQHLAQHGAMVDRYSEKEGVRPNRLMEKSKEDSWNTYENRFVYTLLEMTYDFVNKRYEALFGAMNDEEGAFLKISSESKSYHESLDVNVDIRLRQEEDLLSSDERNESIFARIARLHRLLTTFRGSRFAKDVSKYGKIKPPLIRTNAIAKNPNFKACHKLWNFIMAYRDVGYTINVYDQNPEISDSFMMDIYHTIMFDYMILKNYLENPQDREVHHNKNAKRKQLKPKFITEIIEEIVNNYDLPDVEVRKILIEEITKAQLMKEEALERRRLVEEKEREMRRIKAEQAKEKARQEKEALKERIRLEKEAEKERLRVEKERIEREAREKKAREQFQRDEERLLADMVSEIEGRLKDIETYSGRKSTVNTPAAKTGEKQPKQLTPEQAKAAREKAKQKEREKAAREKAKQKEKEKAAREKAKQKEKEKAAREKAKQKEKEKAARERAKQKEKEKAAKAAAAQKNSGTAAKSTPKKEVEPKASAKETTMPENNATEKADE